MENQTHYERKSSMSVSSSGWETGYFTAETGRLSFPAHHGLLGGSWQLLEKCWKSSCNALSSKTKAREWASSSSGNRHDLSRDPFQQGDDCSSAPGCIRPCGSTFYTSNTMLGVRGCCSREWGGACDGVLVTSSIFSISLSLETEMTPLNDINPGVLGQLRGEGRNVYCKLEWLSDSIAQIILESL